MQTIVRTNSAELQNGTMDFIRDTLLRLSEGKRKKIRITIDIESDYAFPEESKEAYFQQLHLANEQLDKKENLITFTPEEFEAFIQK